uniref:E3 ubiquitin-protein ligase n=1 Tax=Macrostomum lignano TaxID=282301 RepID=A0A1I8FKS7_9PLAT
ASRPPCCGLAALLLRVTWTQPPPPRRRLRRLPSRSSATGSASASSSSRVESSAALIGWRNPHHREPPSSCTAARPPAWFTRCALRPAWTPRGTAARLARRGVARRSACRSPVLTDRLAPPSELQPPRLIRLPPAYDAVFSANRSRACRHCDQRPPTRPSAWSAASFSASIRPACQARHGEDTVGECHRHSVLCGGAPLPRAGGGLLVRVGLHPRPWRCAGGSLYVDEFGEEDEELQTRQALYLSQQRYQALEWQWLPAQPITAAPQGLNGCRTRCELKILSSSGDSTAAAQSYWLALLSGKDFSFSDAFENRPQMAFENRLRCL